MRREENERQEEAKENKSSQKGLAQRRASLIAEFQAYMHTTASELSLASSEETDALRTPLLTMTLAEEDIGAWEKFLPLIQKHLNSARRLHAKINHLLEQAASDRLLDANDLAAWNAFFRNGNVGFQEKERGAQELTKKIAVQKAQNTDEHPLKEKEEPALGRKIPKRDQDSTHNLQKTKEKKQQEEHTPQENLQKREKGCEPEEPLSLLQSTRLHTQWLLTLLPSSIAPLYKTAAERGSTALNAVQKTLEQSLIRQNFGIQHQRGTIIFTRERLQNTEESLATCLTSAEQGEEAKTIILEPISLASQSVVVHGIHRTLLQNLRTLEQHGVQV